MQDKSFGIAGIQVINAVLNYLYLGLLVMCYLLALGNRPQGSKWGYTFAFLGFAAITIYMTVRVVICGGAQSMLMGYFVVRRLLPRDQGCAERRGCVAKRSVTAGGRV